MPLSLAIRRVSKTQLKPLFLIVIAGWATGAIAVESQLPGTIPTAFPQNRYERMVEKSPFALATPVAPPAIPERTFADGWYVSGIARFDGKDFVTVKARDLSVQFSLFGHDAHENGVKLQNIEWSPTIGKSTVTIQKDGQFAKLLFNEAELQSTLAPPPANAPGVRVNPGAPKTSANILPPQNAGQARTIIPRPSQPGVVSSVPQPQPSYPVTGVAPNANAAAPTEGVATQNGARRRIRVINSAPTQ